MKGLGKVLAFDLVFVITVCCLISGLNASCFTSDAKWLKDPPKVTIPSRTNPTKVQVDWSTIIKNQRCVDKYFLWVWKDGQQKGQGKKYVIPDKNTLTKIVDIEPCLFHNFRIELEEDDSSHTDKRASETAKFNSAALPSFNTTDVHQYFTVSYYKDPATNTYDLTKASIKVDSQFMTFASCVKHLEVSGEPKKGAERLAALKAAPSTPKPNYSLPGGDPISWSPYPSSPSMPGGDSISWSPYPSSPSIPGGDPVSWGPYGSGRSVGDLGAPDRRWSYEADLQSRFGWGSGYNSGSSGNSGYNSGSSGNSGYNPGYGGNSGYNPGYGGSSGSGSNSGYNPGNSGSSGYNPGTTPAWGYNPGGNSGSSGNSGYNPGTGGNSGYNPGGNSGSGGNSGYNPGTGGNSGFNPGTTPAWGYNPGGRPPTQSPGSGWVYPTTQRPTIATTTQRSSSSNNRPSYNNNNYGGSNYGGGRKPSFWGQRSMFSNQFLRMQMPPSSKVAGPVKKTPPFTGNQIEIVVPVEACELYDFVLKIISPQGQSIGEVKNLELKSLADIDDFEPAPLTSVMLVDYLMGGKFQVKTQPKSPVPESCLPDYLEAVDAYANKLEAYANENTITNTVVRKNQFHEQQKVEITQAEFLTRQGCVCSSPRLQLRMTKPNGEFIPGLGVYLYQGLWEGKPYYEQDLEQKSTKEFARLTPLNKQRRRKRFIGRVDGGPSTTTHNPWGYQGYMGTTQPPWNYGGGRATTSSSRGSYSTDGYKSSWSSWSSSSGSGSSSSSSSSSSWSSSSSTSSRNRVSGGGGSVSIPIHRVTTTPSTIMRTPEPRLPRYIYWDPSTKQWLLATQKGSKAMMAELEGAKNSKLACPADDPTSTWTSSSPRPGSTVDFSSLKLECAPTY